MTTENYVQIVNAPFIYINGLQLSNDATTPNSILDIALGQCRDSTNEFDMFLNAPITINTLSNGINGLDTGTIADSKVYAVVLISDPVSGNPTGAMFTLTPSQPLMPFGYSAFKTIGYVTTDSMGHLLKGQWTAGGTGARSFTYDIPQATAVTAGGQTTYTTPVDLSALVPSGISELPVNIYYAFTPETVSTSILTLQGVNRTSGGFATKVTAQVSGVIITGNATVVAELNASSSNKPEINYKVVNGSDVVALDVAGYSLSL